MRNDPEYIAYLEGRIARLEANAAGTGSSALPNTKLLSPSFISRSFAVWGHYFVAQVLIAVPIYVLVFFLAIAATSRYGG